jgi:hypothetical protein
VRGWLTDVLFIFTVLWGRVWWSGQTEFEAGKHAEGTGDIQKAVEHYQYAARWFAPFAAAPVAGRSALTRIAEQAEKAGDRGTALKAYRRLRGAILSTRGLLQPGIHQLKPTNIGIARLMAKQQFKGQGPTVRGRTEEQLYTDHLALLTLDPIPSRGWSFLVIISFLVWVWAAFMAIRRGFDANLRIQRRPMIYLSSTALCFFLLWAFALSQA